MIRIFLSSPVGGAGCTTFSANLAYTFSRIGKNVLLTGMEDHSISLHFEGLSSNERHSSNASALQGNIRRILPNLQLKFEGDRRQKTPVHAADTGRIGSRGRGGLSEYDVQIFDRAHTNDDENPTGSDWTVLVTGSTANCYRQLAQYFESLYRDSAAATSTNILTVVNQHVPESPLSTDILNLMSGNMEESLFPGVFLFDELLRESAASGLPLMEFAPYSANQPLFEMLTNHVMTHHDKRHAAA